MADEKKPFHQRVAEECIEALENGTAPWIRPWEPGEMPGPPVNAMTGKPYRGINRIRLTMQKGGDADPRWCTYKQAQELGAQVKKGSKGTTVQYWKFRDEQVLKDEQGKPLLDENGQRRYTVTELERPRVFFSTVFHASQIDNLPPLPERGPEPQPEWERHEMAERLLAASNAAIFHDQRDRAFYRLSSDEIHLPPQAQFASPDKYYATALHELGHWTGHESRLSRDLGHPFGSEKYAREELRAELASYMLGSDLGIGHDPGQHHAYVASWIQTLKEDPREIIRAAQDAERIREYVLGLEREQQTELGADQGISRDEEHYSATSVKAWPNGFPVAYTHTSIAAMKGSHKGADAAQDAADYEAAKQHGDIEAARRLVAKRINPQHLERMVTDLKERGISPEEVIVVPVLEKEQGKNALPRALGEYAAHYLNARLETNIVDTSQSTHTGKETINRLLDRKSFEGPVAANSKYLLVDDVLTQGGTLHELRHYLANNGAEAVGAVTLAFSRYSSTMEHRNTLAIQPDTIDELERRYGRNELEQVLKDHDVSGSLEALSEGEGRFLLGKKFPDIDTLRISLHAAVRARSGQKEAGSEPDVAGGTGGIQGVERGAGQADAAGQAPSDDVGDTGAGTRERYQSITTLFGADALYPEEADAPAVFPLASPVNPRDLAAVFPNAHISPLPDGYQVSVGKLSFGVHSVEHITPETSLFAVSYGREPKADERIAGAVKNGEILIADFLGDKNTIRHESWHLLEDMGMVTQEERDILNHAALKAIDAGELPGITRQAAPVEMRAWYIERQLAQREFDRATPEGKVLQKVADFVDSLANLARRTELGIVRDLETGKLFEREPGEQHNAEHYSTGLEQDQKQASGLAPAGTETSKARSGTNDLNHERAQQPGVSGRSGETPVLAEEKTWLNVPYKEKNAAKGCGAKWDSREKRWYAPVGADLNGLAAWLPDKDHKPAAAPMVIDPREEFSRALLDAGLKLETYPVMDGQIHRVPVMGGKSGAKDGAYCGYEDGRPNGWYQNHKTGQQGKWVANGHTLTEPARNELRQEAAENLTAAESERQEQQEKAKKRAYAKWMNAEVAQEHPYLSKKDIEPLDVRQDKHGNLIVPGYDLESGRIQTLEYINQEGAKWYEKGCPKKGAVCVLPNKEALKEADVVLMVEGYATGASVHLATGLPVAVAFDAGNIKDAARAIKAKMPNARITICADNDPPRPDGTNIGVMKAKEAAASIPGTRVVVADFSQDEKSRGLTDFNDLHKARGLAAVKNAIFPEKRREEEVER